MKTAKKFIGVFLALTMLMSGLPVFAAEDSSEITELYVTSSEELTEAIASSNTVIVLGDGIYELSGALTVSGVENLTIKAENSGKAEILSSDGYNPVVNIIDSQNVSLDGLILGHESLSYDWGCGDGMYSSGYVLYGRSSENITVTGCDLYGCGTVGTVLEGVSGFTAEDCVIRDCKEYIANIGQTYDMYAGEWVLSEDVSFIDCVISGNAYDSTYANNYPAIAALPPVTFRNCRFVNNYSTVFVSAEQADNVITEDCTFENNIWDEKTPDSYGVCLNGITWQSVWNPQTYRTTLRLGFDLELENSVIESAGGEILPYSSYSLPWKDITFDEVELAEGIVYNLGGALGDNLTWSLELSTGEMTVSGTGAMIDLDYSSRPWKSYSSMIKTITIGEGVTSVGDYAFYSCSNLTSLSLPQGLESIGENAFSSCYRLESLTLPESLKTIESWAFNSCFGLESLTIPKNVESIGTQAFSGSSHISAIDVDDENACYTDLDGVLFNKDMTVLMQYPGGKSGSSYTVPSGVETIDSFAFYECGELENITVSEGVKSMGDRAIIWCERLKTVSLPSTLEELGGSFEGYMPSCDNLKSVTVAEGNPDYTDVDGVVYSKDMKTLVFFPAGHSIFYTIPDGVETIGASAFDGSSVVSVDFPESITYIGEDAFNYCENLTKVELPANSSGIEIGNSAFYYCTSLTAFIAPADTVTSIGWNAFSYGNDNLTIYCPAGSVIETYAIENGINYADIADYEEEVITGEGWSIQNGILSITADMPYNEWYDNNWSDYSEDIKIISVEEGVTEIPNYAFSSLWETQMIILPESLETIASNSFNSLGNISSLYLGKNVSDIGEGAFSSCYNLSAIEVSEENPYFVMEGNVLYSSDKTRLLRYLPAGSGAPFTLPATVTDIDLMAFASNGYDGYPTEILVEEGSESFASVDGVLFNKDVTTLIVYPAPSERTYYDMPDTVTRIEESAFDHTENLTSLTFSSKLTEIGDDAFSNSRALTEITLPRSLRTIGDFAFQGCWELKSVTLTEGVTDIGRYAFASCDALESVVIPSSVENIGDNAFSYCENVTVYGEAGSFAETYAAENGLSFQVLETVVPEITSANVTQAEDGSYEITVETVGGEGAVLLAVGYSYEGEALGFDEFDGGSASIGSDGVQIIKIFFWDSLTSMQPLCAPRTLAVGAM